jgi:hypothetical protein
MKAKYRSNLSGKLLWKISAQGDVIEVNLESYEFGIIGVTHVKASSIWSGPGNRATPIPKAEFERYYREALERFKKT